MLGALAAAPAPAYAVACAGAGRPSRALPYEERLYDLDRLRPLADGSGVRVAVLDSGVDSTNPQLRGRVSAGRDLLGGGPDGRHDCVGHGTGVASIIAARPVDGVAFRGLAPGATVVPVRVSEPETIGGRSAAPQQFAQAIDWAADPAGGGAQVLNLSLVMTADDPRVRRAVARALQRGVVVVAAVGNAATDGNPTPYPAAYPGVIGVGAIGVDGQRAGYSQHGAYVDVMAAGEAVTVAAPGGGHVTGRGTSYAVPFVAATAVLLRQRFPAMTPAQVSRQILGTADPAPGGVRSDEYGYGLLNPYRALTETLPGQRPPPPPPAPAARADPAVAARLARRWQAQDRALRVAAAGAAAAVLLGAGAAVVRRGRRRGWRPGTG
ncbi:type VII secretion-associated serine protease mycosin [Krasilnikovia sp. MM14-A1259]|uniref:type VII secretion-associated serine protease mycosin n=1 Tax=Krasilnikovia sp. MM14-A1259 TaxID=3373539 RepID=UPI00399CAD56